MVNSFNERDFELTKQFYMGKEVLQRRKNFTKSPYKFDKL